MNHRLADLFRETLFQQPSLEATTPALEELEYIFYVKVEDFTQLSEASAAERQEQWSVFLTNDTGVEANVRIRATNNERYTLTSKFYLPNAKGKWEIEREVEQEHFELMRSLAEGGMIKERYRFPVEGHEDLVWEVDVHYTTGGKRIPWVRIELEVPGKLDTIPPLPIQGSETILRQPKHQTDQEQAFVKDLYQNHYVQKPVRASQEDVTGDGFVAAPDGEKVVDEDTDQQVVSDDVKLNGNVGDTPQEEPNEGDDDINTDQKDDPEEAEESEDDDDADNKDETEESEEEEEA